MLSWLAPFVVLLVVVLLYFYASGSRADRKQAMKNDINFYLVCVLAVAVVSIIASLRHDAIWLETAVWIMGAVAIAAVVWRFISASPTEPKAKSQGPLEENDDRK